MPTVKFTPSAYSVSSSNRVSVTNANNMYYDTSHTANYCSIRGRNSSSSGPYYAFIHGFNFTGIPDDALIQSISIKIRCYKNSYLATGSSYRLRLASSPSNSSAIADTTLSTDITTTSGGTVYTFPLGDLDWDTIKSYGTNFSIEVPLMSTSNQYPYLYVYGAEVQVTYALPVYHNVTSSSEISNVTISPSGTQQALEGSDVEFSITSDGTNFIITDNGIDVTNQLVQLQPSGSETVTANGYSSLSNGVTINSSYPIARAQDDADDTSNYTRLDFSTSTTGYIELTYNFSDIPAGATITSVVARARLRISSTSRMTNRVCQLYAGSSAKGSNSDFSSTTSGGALVTLNTGNSWSASDFTNLKMRIGATSSSSTSSKYLYIYGTDITVSYTLSGKAYTYTITNITTDHVVIISSESQDQLYIKVNNSWIKATKVYKKVNGSWVEQTDLTNIFTSGVYYKYL